MHHLSEPSILYFGTPVVLITTTNSDGTNNIAPISSIFWLGWRAIIGISTFSKTTDNIRRTGECVLNLPSIHQTAAVNRLARSFNFIIFLLLTWFTNAFSIDFIYSTSRL